MTTPTVYAPSAYPSVPLAPQGNGYPGYAPVAPVAPAVGFAPATPGAATVPTPSATPSYGTATPQQQPYPGAPLGSPAIASVTNSAPMNVLAVVGFVTSLLGLGFVSIVLSIIGLRQIKAKGERGGGFAIAGLAISGVTLIFIAISLAILAVLNSIGEALFTASY